MTDEKKLETHSPKELAVNTERLKYIASKVKKKLAEKKGAVYEIGKLLCEAAKEYKYDLGKGFMRWHEENFGSEFSYPTAHNYMRVYLCCPGPEVVQHFPLKLLYKICAATFPEELRQFILDHAKRFNTKTKVEDVKSAADKVKRLGFDSNDPEVKKLLLKREEKEELREHIKNMDGELKALASLWKEFFSALTGMPQYREKYVLTREQKDQPI